MSNELRSKDTGPSLHLERDYAATPEELWQCWTDPARLARWLGFPEGPVLDAPGPVRLVMGDADDQWITMRVLAADPPRSLTVEWHLPGRAGTTLTVQLVPLAPGRTRLIVDHDGLGRTAVGYGAGWEAYLDGGLLNEVDHADSAELSWQDLFDAALPKWRERASAIA